MNKKERWIIYPFLIILIIVAFTALCQEYPRIGGFDYLGFIMGILSFLLAILAVMFGYNILDIKGRIKENVEKEFEGVKLDIEKLQSEVLFLRSKVVVRKIFVKGNIVIETKKFKCKDLIAYAKDVHMLNAEIIDEDLIIKDSSDFDPNAEYYASGDIISHVVCDDE